MEVLLEHRLSVFRCFVEIRQQCSRVYPSERPTDDDNATGMTVGIRKRDTLLCRKVHEECRDFDSLRTIKGFRLFDLLSKPYPCQLIVLKATRRCVTASVDTDDAEVMRMRKREEFLEDRCATREVTVSTMDRHFSKRINRDNRTSVETHAMDQHPCRIAGRCRRPTIQICVVEIEDFEGIVCRRRHVVSD